MGVPPIKRAYDALVPFLLVVILSATVVFRVQTVNEFNSAALSTRLTACGAVRASNDDLYTFLVKQLSTGERARDPRSISFLEDLRSSQADTYRKCLEATS